ncbi:MAG: hypothetical protein ABI600_13270 [Luteolibacter sp.]
MVGHAAVVAVDHEAVVVVAVFPGLPEAVARVPVPVTRALRLRREVRFPGPRREAAPGHRQEAPVLPAEMLPVHQAERRNVLRAAPAVPAAEGFRVLHPPVRLAARDPHWEAAHRNFPQVPTVHRHVPVLGVVQVPAIVPVPAMARATVRAAGMLVISSASAVPVVQVVPEVRVALAVQAVPVVRVALAASVMQADPVVRVELAASAAQADPVARVELAASVVQADPVARVELVVQVVPVGSAA